MKKQMIYKTVQLALLLAVTIFIICRIFPDAELYHWVANDRGMKLLSVTLWIVLLISFIFIFFDYSYFLNYLKQYKEMELAAKSDPVSGIANRFNCDMVIEKYIDKVLPENIGVVMINLSNMEETNRLHGHLSGNMIIRDFSNILRISSSDLCFVGRNGGINFLAVFEACDDEKINKFLERVSQRVTVYNRDIKNLPIEYSYGKAFSGSDNVSSITELIGLANSRVTY